MLRWSRSRLVRRFLFPTGRCRSHGVFPFSFFHPVKYSERFCSYVGVMKDFGGYGGGKLGGGGLIWSRHGPSSLSTDFCDVNDMFVQLSLQMEPFSSFGAWRSPMAMAMDG